MKKEFLKIGIAILVLLGIAIPLSLHREKKINKAIAEQDSGKFVEFSFETVKKIKFTNKSGQVELERREKNADGKYNDEFETRGFEFSEPQKWIVTKPYRALADSMIMDGFLNQIHLLETQKTIQDTKERKADYNLAPPVLSIDLFDSAAATEPKLTIDMGSENPSTTGYYFMTSSKPGIYLADRILQPYENQELDEWKEKKVIGFANINDIEKITITHTTKKDLSFEVTKTDAEWKLGRVEDKLPADVIQINKFISHIDGIRATKIIDDVSVMKKAKQVGEVEFNIKNRKEKLSFKVYQEGQKYYVQRNDLKPVFLIYQDDEVLPTFQNVVSKRLVIKGMSDLQAMGVSYNGKSLEMKKEKEEWKIKKPVEDAANIRRIETVVKILSEVKPQLYLKSKIIDEKYQKLKFVLEFSKEFKNTVTFYRQGNDFFAKIEDGNQPRLVSIPQIPMELYEHLSHMRDDSLIPFSHDKLKRIVFKRGEPSVDIEFTEGKRKSWYLKSLQNVSAGVSMKWKEELTAEEFYNRISEMYITDFVESPDASIKYDTATLELYDTTGKIFVWKFGNKQGQMISLYSEDRKVVGRIPMEQYNDLATFLDEPEKKSSLNK
jgi:hypothetical protein